MGQGPGIDLTRVAAGEVVQATRQLVEARAAALAGRRPRRRPRPVIGESWLRMIRRGVDPEEGSPAAPLGADALEPLRHHARIGAVLPLLRERLVPVAEAADHIMVVCDPQGRVLWREGSTPVLRRADGISLMPGADWREGEAGTNGIGTALVVRRPVQVTSAEHFVSRHHPWTCAGAPITDPRDGRLLGVVDLSGPLGSLHPAMPALVGSVAKLAEAWLRERHAAALDRLRATGTPLLSRAGGRALVVDAQGWTAAVSGMAPIDRLALPTSFGAGTRRLPALGACAVEPLPGGWLIRLETGDTPAVTRVTLDVSGARRWWITVAGEAGDWTHELSPRHAELLYLLAARPAGRTASELAAEVFGAPERTVTVRAELSRVRRYLGGVLEHRPYRFREDVEVAVVAPRWPAELLPHSVAPTVLRARCG
ncbi:GAF domain-containing protein [Streptomyces sp. NPDC050560]|uniref:helix-turn-helix domain-containing protein n=1 Tax=Streptomyces sp. NPDC050560 TaxID=3365630 RepID=UPI0037945487